MRVGPFRITECVYIYSVFLGRWFIVFVRVPKWLGLTKGREPMTLLLLPVLCVECLKLGGLISQIEY